MFQNSLVLRVRFVKGCADAVGAGRRAQPARLHCQQPGTLSAHGLLPDAGWHSGAVGEAAGDPVKYNEYELLSGLWISRDKGGHRILCRDLVLGTSMKIPATQGHSMQGVRNVEFQTRLAPSDVPETLFQGPSHARWNHILPQCKWRHPEAYSLLTVVSGQVHKRVHTCQLPELCRLCYGHVAIHTTWLATKLQIRKGRHGRTLSTHGMSLRKDVSHRWLNAQHCSRMQWAGV